MSEEDVVIEVIPAFNRYGVFIPRLEYAVGKIGRHDSGRMWCFSWVATSWTELTNEELYPVINAANKRVLLLNITDRLKR